jgi:alpha-L-rhamnosidase
VADDIRRIDAYFVASGGYRTLPGAGAALQRDRVICSGAETETYEPKFSYKGFRYVTVDGLRGEIDPADIEGCVVSTAFPKTGSFTCSDELFNRLMAAADRSYRCNFTVAVPTDCPHREKNGWMGDAAASVETAQYLYDNTAAYRKWVADISDAQRPSGELPGIVPTSGWGYFWGNGPGWDAALGVVAEAVYRHKGDPRLLIEVYPALKKLCGFYAREKLRGDLVDWGLGDWCAPKPEKMPTVAYTSSCHVMRTHEIAALAAELCGRADEGRAFTAQARKIRAALRATFMKSPGVFDNGGQTAQGMAIEYGLVEPGEWKAAGDRLVAAFDAEDGASAGGIYGMRHNFRALSRIGRTDLAFQALTRKDGRSPALFLSDGGGTLWEDWEDRASRNHVMFCDFAGWAYAHLAGIRPIESGYRKILFAPETVSALDFVDASVETPRGTVRSAWRRRGAVVTFDVRVPEGCTAEIRLPGGLVRALGPGRHQLEEVGK